MPIAFTVASRLRVDLVAGGLGGIALSEERVEPPYRKDYDAVEAEAPLRWPERFDLSRWGFLAALSGERRVGGAAIAWRTEGVHFLEGRDDIAALWDIRVAPEARGAGVGAALFGAAADWARSRGARFLKIETQNTNVGACRFYQRMGCALGAIERFCYPELPGEVGLIWYLELGP